MTRRATGAPRSRSGGAEPEHAQRGQRDEGRRRLTLGLGLVRIEVPSRDDLGSLTDRLTFHGVQTRDDGRTVAFDDPWANRILVRTAP